MFLIMSAKYIDEELKSEFGRLPPSFLPLGNKRLYQYQVKLANSNSDVFLSIPESYELCEFDELWLKKHGVKLIQTSEDLKLGEALIAAINLSESKLDTPLNVLFGDTLFNVLPNETDTISVSLSDSDYNWTDIDEVLEYSSVERKDYKAKVNGFFSFSKPRELLYCLTKEKGDFFASINMYSKKRRLTTFESSDWMDFGHVNTYYRSKSKFTTQRSFNNLTITSDYIEKSSTNDDKIAAEANWFRNLPYSLKHYTPNYLGSRKQDGQFSYRLEYLYNTPLNELYVFADISIDGWRNILSIAVNFLLNCERLTSNSTQDVNKLTDYFCFKTNSRLEKFCASRNITLTDEWLYKGNSISLQQMIKIANENLPNEGRVSSIIHGDFCFSNILFDTRAQKIKVIDPRGFDVYGNKTLFGDIRYDVAKLSHSILGLYDLIIAGCYDVSISGRHIDFEIYHKEKHKEVQSYFVDLIKNEIGLSLTELRAMQIHLFLSMLPLHTDDPHRQDALFANAFRICDDLIKEKK